MYYLKDKEQRIGKNSDALRFFKLMLTWKFVCDSFYIVKRLKVYIWVKKKIY